MSEEFRRPDCACWRADAPRGEGTVEGCCEVACSAAVHVFAGAMKETDACDAAWLHVAARTAADMLIVGRYGRHARDPADAREVVARVLRDLERPEPLLAAMRARVQEVLACTAAGSSH